MSVDGHIPMLGGVYSLESVTVENLATVYDDDTDEAIGAIFDGGEAPMGRFQAWVGLPGARRAVGWHHKRTEAMREIVLTWRAEVSRRAFGQRNQDRLNDAIEALYVAP